MLEVELDKTSASRALVDGVYVSVARVDMLSGRALFCPKYLASVGIARCHTQAVLSDKVCVVAALL